MTTDTTLWHRHLRPLVLGPFAASSRTTRWIGVGVTVLLTLVTQVGGILTWPAWGMAARGRSRGLLRGLALGAALYTVGALAVVPFAAGLCGRVPLPIVESNGLAPRSPFFWVLQRHYVERHVRTELEAMAASVARPGLPVRYLDASFPLPTPLWMLPHASHAGGHAVDLALPLLDPATGSPIDGGGSPIGYWGYVALEPGERHVVEPRLLDLRWDFELLQGWIGDTSLDEERLAALVVGASERGSVGKALLEPRLEARLADRLTGPQISLLRYQGDFWARHDDHVHLTFR
jgi:hypothetical protein